MKKLLFSLLFLAGAALRADISDNFDNLSLWATQPSGPTFGGALQINTAGPQAVWLTTKLTAPYTVSFDVVVAASSGGSTNNLADVDFYFGAQGASVPIVSTYADMLHLNCYQVGIGSSMNTATRLRKLPGNGTIPTPLVDHAERCHMLKSNVTYHVILTVAADGTIDVTRNSVALFHYVDSALLSSGWFGFWTFNTRQTYNHFLVTTP